MEAESTCSCPQLVYLADLWKEKLIIQWNLADMKFGIKEYRRCFTMGSKKIL